MPKRAIKFVQQYLEWWIILRCTMSILKCRMPNVCMQQKSLKWNCNKIRKLSVMNVQNSKKHDICGIHEAFKLVPVNYYHITNIIIIIIVNTLFVNCKLLPFNY